MDSKHTFCECASCLSVKTTFIHRTGSCREAVGGVEVLDSGFRICSPSVARFMEQRYL